MHLVTEMKLALTILTSSEIHFLITVNHVLPVFGRIVTELDNEYLCGSDHLLAFDRIRYSWILMDEWCELSTCRGCCNMLVHAPRC